MQITLYTIPISHYGERARWALDHAGLDYDERHHLQMFSWFVAWGIGGHKTLPVVETNQRTLTDSADVVQWASEQASTPLYPDDRVKRDEILTFEYEMAQIYGVETRRFAYGWFFRSLDLCLPYNAGRAPNYQLALLDQGRAVAMPIAKKYLQVSPERELSARDICLKTLDKVAKRLADGRPFLFGDQFTAADLTFASLSAPSVLPTQFPVPLPQLEDLPTEAADWITLNRNHPAGQFVMRMYNNRPPTRGRYDHDLRVKVQHGLFVPTTSGC